MGGNEKQKKQTILKQQLKELNSRNSATLVSWAK